MRKLLISLVLLLAVPLSVRAVQLKSFESVEWPKARAVVSLGRENAKPSFSLDVDGAITAGKASKIEDMGNPVNVVFCVDVSESVGYNLKQLKPLLADIAGLFGTNDTFTLVIFSNEVKIPIQFSSNPSEVAMEVGQLEASDKETYIFDALAAADDLLNSKPDTKGIIFLFSDGADTGSKLQDKVSDKFPVISVAPPAGVQIHVLTGIAKQTNGLFFSAGDFKINELQTFTDNYKNWKNSVYTVEFEDLPQIASGHHDFNLVVDDGKTKIELPVSVDIEGKQSNLWIWILAGILGVAALIALLMMLKKNHVPKGKKVVEKAPPQDLHYLAWISLVEDEDRQLRIRKNHVLIGTDQNADFYVDDPTVSVRHAQIIEKADGFYIEDAESVMGTFLNKKRVLEPQKLNDGDIIKVGDTELKFTQSDFAYVSKKKVI